MEGPSSAAEIHAGPQSAGAQRRFCSARSSALSTALRLLLSAEYRSTLSSGPSGPGAGRPSRVVVEDKGLCFAEEPTRLWFHLLFSPVV